MKNRVFLYQHEKDPKDPQICQNYIENDAPLNCLRDGMQNFKIRS